MAHTAGAGIISFVASSSLTALSLALRLVVARGWAGPQVGSSWPNAGGSCTSRAHCSRLIGDTRHGPQTISRAPPHLCLFGGGASNSAGSVCTGKRQDGLTNGQQRRSFADTWRRGSSWSGSERAAGTVRVSSHRSGFMYASTLAAGDDRGDAKLNANKGKPGRRKAASSSVSLSSSPSTSAPAGVLGGTSGGGSRGGPKLLRLSKLLADRAVGSRSEVDALVRRGRVKVDGAVVKSPKIKLPVDCVIEVNGQECGPVPLLVAFHKPKGVITTLSDDWDREDLSDVLPKSLLLKHHPVGRLDADSSGLLLLSSDGALTHRLLNPRFEVEREYVATVDVSDPGAGEPGDALVAALREGVSTADGVYKADVAGIDGKDVRVVVREGKNRMVRRMLANAGYPVLELKRERYGNILLGGLPEGDHAPVSGEALAWAKSVFQLQPAAAAENGGDEGRGAGR